MESFLVAKGRIAWFKITKYVLEVMNMLSRGQPQVYKAIQTSLDKTKEWKYHYLKYAFVCTVRA